MVDAITLRRLLTECTGPDDVIGPVADFVLQRLSQAERHRERAFHLETALGFLPAEWAPWTKARALHDEMVAAQNTPAHLDATALRSAVREVLKISRKPLTTRQLNRLLTADIAVH